MQTVSFVKTADIVERIDALFESEKKKLHDLLPDADIEHIGGTAISGAISKGDLDINVRVKPENFERVMGILKTLYEINQPDNWTPGFASFKDDSRDLGIQLTTVGSADDYFVAQRDYLKKHPETVSELNALKERFEGKDMNEYRQAKSKFFEELNSRFF